MWPTTTGFVGFAMLRPLEETHERAELLKYMSARLALVEGLERLEKDVAWRGLMAIKAVAEYARRVAQRISQRLAEDAELPRLTVSVGVAEYPRDGLTIEHLLNAADHALYEIKLHAASSSLTLSSS